MPTQGMRVPPAWIFRRRPLLRIEGKDHRAVLRAGVIPLAHSLSWVVRFPELLQQFLVRDLLRIVDDAHHFRMPGIPAADFLVGRVRRESAGIADRR